MSTKTVDIAKGSKVDRFTVLKKLGEGGMGSVYLCSYEFDSDVREGCSSSLSKLN